MSSNFQSNNSSTEGPLISQDQLADQLENLELLIDRSHLDSAHYLGRQIVKSAKFYKLKETKLQAIYQLARIHNRRNKFEKSDTFLNTALNICEDDELSFDMLILGYNNAMRLGEFEIGKSRLSVAKQFITDTSGVNMVRYRYSLADYYNIAVNDNKRVLELLLLAKKDAPDNIDYKHLFKINYQLGALYEGIEVHDQAIQVGIEIERSALENEDHYLQLFGIYTQLASTAALQDHDNIYKLVQRAISIKEKYGESTAFGYLYFVQGQSYLEQEVLDSAFHYFDFGEELSLERNSKLDLANNYLGKSHVYFKRKEYAKAKEFADSAKKVYPDGVDGLEEFYWQLAAVDGDYKSAYDGALKSFESVNDELESDDNYEILSKLLTDKFSAEKEQQELEVAEKERKNKLLFAQSLAIFLISFLLVIAGMQIRNRNKLEKLNSSLIKRNEALINFSYISSHDLKEPVRNIVSFSELLHQNLKEADGHPKELEFASIIKNSSITLLEIVKSLKIFSETAFDEEVQLDVFDIGGVFNDLASNMQQLIKSKNAQVSFNNVQRIASITFSKPMLYLLLQNLIQNALKYNSSDEPEVVINVSSKGEDYLFQISDNGNGIEAGKLEYIFKPFKTLQSKSLTQSSGLGLSICKNILDRFKGKIWVESEVGQGSTFLFTIPMKLANV